MDSLKIKEIVLAAMMVAILIGQNYLLYSFPITLTYVILYIISNKIKPVSVGILSVSVFVTVKNMLYMALPLTIVADLIGLTFVVLVSRMRPKWLRFILIPITIVAHLLLLDLSWAITAGNVLLILPLLIGGSISYIYCPLSIIIILLLENKDFITNEKFNI